MILIKLIERNFSTIFTIDYNLISYTNNNNNNNNKNNNNNNNNNNMRACAVSLQMGTYIK